MNASRVGLNNWMPISAGRTGFSFTRVFGGQGQFRVEFYIDAADATGNEAYLDALMAKCEVIEASVGIPLAWDPMPNRRAKRVYAERQCCPMVDVAADDEFREWAVTTMMRMNEVFRPLGATTPGRRTGGGGRGVRRVASSRSPSGQLHRPSRMHTDS
jgi:hypothetical protein